MAPSCIKLCTQKWLSGLVKHAKSIYIDSALYLASSGKNDRRSLSQMRKQTSPAVLLIGMTIIYYKPTLLVNVALQKLSTELCTMGEI